MVTKKLSPYKFWVKKFVLTVFVGIMETSRRITIEQLPLEILQEIFVLSENPDFAHTSRTFRTAASSRSSVKAQWLVNKYSGNYQFALRRGLRYRFFNKEILAQLDAMFYQSQLRQKKQDPQRVIPYERKSIQPRLFKTSDPDSACYELVKALLQRNASPDEPNGYPIVKSAQLGRLDMVKLLLEYRANAKTQGTLALMSCARRGHIEIAKLLLENEVMPDALSLRIAHQRKDWAMVKLLSDYGATPDDEGRWPDA
jgi:hypothetical protein